MSRIEFAVISRKESRSPPTDPGSFAALGGVGEGVALSVSSFGGWLKMFRAISDAPMPFGSSALAHRQRHSRWSGRDQLSF